MSTSILIDGPYLASALRAIKARISYERLASALQHRYTPVQKAIFYTDAKLQRSARLRKLSEQGFEVRFIPESKSGPAGLVKRLDVQIAVDLIEQTQSSEKIALLSGDADFAPSIEVLRKRGVTVEVIAFLPHLARGLRDAAGTVVDLMEILATLSSSRQTHGGSPSRNEESLWLLKGVHPQHRKDLTAVWAGVLLERGLRDLCKKHHLPESTDDGVDALNNRLVKSGIYTKLTQKKIIVWAEIRNSAAHGQFHNYTDRDALEMEKWVANFLKVHAV